MVDWSEKHPDQHFVVCRTLQIFDFDCLKNVLRLPMLEIDCGTRRGLSLRMRSGAAVSRLLLLLG